MKANKKTDKVKTGLPVNEIRILCRTTAPVDVIRELGQSKNMQEFKRFTYLGFEFRITEADIAKLPDRQTDEEVIEGMKAPAELPAEAVPVDYEEAFHKAAGDYHKDKQAEIGD